MRYAQVILGILLLLKGLRECIALPRALSALHLASPLGAGKGAGMVVGTVAVLAGGALLLAFAWRSRRAAGFTGAAGQPNRMR